jgi:hypothetical protein
MPAAVAMTAAVILGFVAGASAQPAPATGVDPTLFQELRWRMIGPSAAAACWPWRGAARAAHFYFGSVNGGVWETRDAGRTWSPDLRRPGHRVDRRAGHRPSDPKVIYVGTGEADMRSDIAQGDGVYGPATAADLDEIGLGDTQQIGRILVDPARPERGAGAALGHPYGPQRRARRVPHHRRRASWPKVLYKDADTGAIDLAFRPGDPSVSTPRSGRRGGRRGTCTRLRTARAAGSTSPPTAAHVARARGHGLSREPGRIGLALAPSRPDRVYAMVDAPKGGLYRSDDGGRDLVVRERRPPDLGPRLVLRRGGGGAARSRRGLREQHRALPVQRRRPHLRPVKGAPGGDDYHELWIDPAAPERRIVGATRARSSP